MVGQKKIDKRFVDIFSNQHELEIVDGCLLYQDRVVIPQIMQSGILRLLHANHAGIVKMKQLARKTVYWFGINSDIEKFAANCDICSSMAVVPKPKGESKWIPTIRPFSRVHLDFFHFEHRTFLLMVDSFSKWIEVDYMKNGTDSGKVLKKLVAFFARFGLPDVLVSDGGPPFNSYSFVSFLERQGIKVLKSPPYNPSSNGQAERLVRTVKEVLKKFLMEPETKDLDWEDQINLFLITYRNTCLTNDGKFPSERIFNYKPKVLIDLLNPKKHYKRQMSPPLPHDEKFTCPTNVGVKPTKVGSDITNDTFNNLMEGDVVWYKNHNPHNHMRWLKANFLKRFSKNTFQIMIGNVPVVAHRDQMRLHNRTLDGPKLVPFVTNQSEEDIIPSSNQNIEKEDISGGLPERAAPSRDRKRKHPISVSCSGVRRSKRLRKSKLDDNYIYN